MRGANRDRALSTCKQQVANSSCESPIQTVRGIVQTSTVSSRLCDSSDISRGRSFESRAHQNFCKEALQTVFKTGFLWGSRLASQTEQKSKVPALLLYVRQILSLSCTCFRQGEQMCSDPEVGEKPTFSSPLLELPGTSLGGWINIAVSFSDNVIVRIQLFGAHVRRLDSAPNLI